MTCLAVQAVVGLALLLPAFAQQRRDPGPPPHLVMEQLSRMSPEERARMFAGLPEERRKLIEQRLEKYNALPPAAKEQLRDEYNQFQKLSPEQQDEVRKMFRQFNEFSEERRKLIRRELYRLRGLNPARRAARVNSEAFRVEYSDGERQLLETLVTLLAKDPPPPRPPVTR